MTNFGDFPGNAPLYGADVHEFFDPRRSSEVVTIPRLLAQGSVALTSGQVYGALAIARTVGTFTKARFCAGTTVTALTDLRVGVYDSAGTTKLSESANLTAPSANALVDNIALGTSVVLTDGQLIYLAVGYVGTALQVRGAGLLSTYTGAIGSGPALSRTTTGFTTGSALPAAITGTASAIPWIELIP